MTTTKKRCFYWVLTWKLLLFTAGGRGRGAKGGGERGIDFWWDGIFLGGGMMSKFLAGEEKTPSPPLPPPSPSRENPDLQSSLRFF